MPARPADQAVAGFAGLDAPIGVAGPAEVLDWLAVFLDWPVAAAPAAPDVRVEPGGRGFRIVGGNGPDAVRTTATAIDAANFATAAMIEALVAADPALARVHAAALDGPAGLVLLVGASGAGKSSIALHLARAGHRLFADDQIVLRLAGRPVEGIALGLRPKVRRPIPASFGPSFEAFVRTRTALTTDDFLALALDATLQAPFASRRPVAAIVLVERLPEGPARLERTAAASALRRLLAETIGQPDRTAGRVAALAQLCAAVPAFQLIYADSVAAAAALRATVPAFA
ncbi:MAG: hypothetical protein AB7O45_00045 [Alphaproteobacteria bacterium]